MNGLPCDSCRVFAPGQPQEGWLFVLRQDAPSFSSFAALLGGGGGGTELAGTFCSLRCLAEHAYVKLAADRAGGPSGAEGWIG